jgi:hypothetical protein
MTKPYPTALAIGLLAVAAVAIAGPDQTTAQTSPAQAPAAHGAAKTAQAVPSLSRKPARRLDLTPPNFTSSEWQQRLQGPTIDHSQDYLQMESVVVNPPAEAPNLVLAPAGLGSLYWALKHPTRAWQILTPVQEGDEFNTDTEIALAYQDPNSDCPGFPGTPNVRPNCQ